MSDDFTYPRAPDDDAQSVEHEASVEYESSVEHEPSEGRRRPLTIRDILVLGSILQEVVLLTVAAEAVGIEIPLVRPVFAVLLLSFVPGVLCLALLGVREQSPMLLALYAIGTSLLVIMVLGVVSSLVYPIVGITRPISEPWVVVTVALVNLALGGAVARRLDREAVITEIPLRRPTPADLLLFALPFVGILAIAVLNRFETNVAVIGFLVVVSVVPALALVGRSDSKNYALVVWASALSLLYYKSLWQRSYPLEMWVHQMVIEQGRWVPIIGGSLAALPDIRGMGMEGVLTDAVLYPIYALTAGIETMTQLEVINPLFVALIPLVMYETFRRYVHERDAMLAAFVFFFMFRFYTQHYPNAPRDVMATLFLVLFGLLMADSHIDRNVRRILAPVFVAGIGVSHYGAAYIVLASLFLSVVLLFVLDAIERRTIPSLPNFRTLIVAEPGNVITFLLVIFSTVFILSWYLFAGGGTKFQVLIEHVSRLLEPVGMSGLSSRRVLSDKPFSIEMTRNMTIAVFALVGVGTLVEGIRRLVGMRPTVSDEHLSITVGLVTIFAASFLSIGTGFGKGRILMIALSFASVFAVLALHDVRNVSTFLAERYDALVPVETVVTGVFTKSRIRAAWAVFLCAFLLFNTGVVAETVTRNHDSGASIIVNNERLSRSEDPDRRLYSVGCIECDIGAQVWTLRYGKDGMDVYDGGVTKNYVWYGHSVVVGVDDFVSDYLLENRTTLYIDTLPAEWSLVDDGSYIVFTSDNYQSGLVFTSNDESRSLREVRAELGRSNKIYTTGHSVVYRFRNGTVERATDEVPSIAPQSDGTTAKSASELPIRPLENRRRNARRLTAQTELHNRNPRRTETGYGVYGTFRDRAAGRTPP